MVPLILLIFEKNKLMKNKIILLLILLYPCQVTAQSASYITLQISKESEYEDEFGESASGGSQITLNFEDSLINGKRQFKLWYYSCSIREGENTYGFSSSDSIDQVFNEFSTNILALGIEGDFPPLSEQFKKIYSNTSADFQPLVTSIIDTFIIRQAIESYTKSNGYSKEKVKKETFNFLDGMSGIHKPVNSGFEKNDSANVLHNQFVLMEKPVRYFIELGETTGNYEPNPGSQNKLDQYITFDEDGETVETIKWVQIYDCTGFFGLNELEGLTFTETGKIEIEIFKFGE